MSALPVLSSAMHRPALGQEIASSGLLRSVATTRQCPRPLLASTFPAVSTA
jgi:hypothetical protein